VVEHLAIQSAYDLELTVFEACSYQTTVLADSCTADPGLRQFDSKSVRKVAESSVALLFRLWRHKESLEVGSL